MEPNTLFVAITTKISVNMSVGISNVEIEKIFNDANNGDLNEDFIGVFLSNKINKFILFDKIMPGLKYVLNYKYRQIWQKRNALVQYSEDLAFKRAYFI